MKRLDVFNVPALCLAGDGVPNVASDALGRITLMATWKDGGYGYWSNSTASWKNSGGWSNSTCRWKNEGFGQWTNSTASWRNDYGWSNSTASWRNSDGWTNSGGK